MHDFRLLRQGAHINVAVNKNGCGALHIVCTKLRITQPQEFLEVLLDPEWGPDLELQTHFLQLRPLHCAISARNRQCVALLLQATFFITLYLFQALRYLLSGWSRL